MIRGLDPIEDASDQVYFAWSDVLTAKYDSNWMRWALLGSLNRLEGHDLRVVGLNRLGWKKGTSLWIQCAFGASPLERGSLLACLVHSDVLRFCTDCLSVGYHSYLHQLRELRTCPLHGRALTSACPSCGSEAVSFCGVFAPKRALYRCGQCRALMYPTGPSKWIKKRRFLKDEKEAFDSLDSQLFALKGWRATPYRASSDDRRCDFLSATADESALMFQEAAASLLNRMLGVRRIDDHEQSPGLVCRTESDFQQAIKAADFIGISGWRSLYRSVRRQLQRRVRRPHGPCFAPSFLKMIGVANDRDPGGKRLCPMQLAFAEWRRRWEWEGPDRNEFRWALEEVAGFTPALWVHNLLGQFHQWVDYFAPSIRAYRRKEPRMLHPLHLSRDAWGTPEVRVQAFHPVEQHTPVIFGAPTAARCVRRRNRLSLDS
jgi:hypothetical protein